MALWNTISNPFPHLLQSPDEKAGLTGKGIGQSFLSGATVKNNFQCKHGNGIFTMGG
jgi:hypothetical protein